MRSIRDGFVLKVDARTSQRMAGVRQRGTEAELAVRHVVSTLGLRYRISNRDLPGSPDLANRARQWVVFVHGCFWHRHPGCVRTTTPKRNREFWRAKFAANRRRDVRNIMELQRRGYTVIIVWECELTDPSKIASSLAKALRATARCRI